MLSCSFLIHEFEVAPSSILFFLLRTPLGDYVIIFLLFFNAAYISSLVLLTLDCGFYGFSFWWTNKYLKIFVKIRVDWYVSFLPPLFSLTYLYHQSSSSHKLLYIICIHNLIKLVMLLFYKLALSGLST